MSGNTVDLDRLERVAARLGDAAIDPSIWSEIMQEISAAAGALQTDVRTPNVPCKADAGDDNRGSYVRFDARDERPFGDSTQQLTEPTTLSWAVGRAALTGMTDALELVRQPALALDRSGLVLDHNRAAASYLGNDMHVRNRKLVLSDRHAAAALESLIDQLHATSDTAPLQTEPIFIRREDRQPLVMTISPVDGAARTPFLGARVLVTLTDLDAEAEPDAAMIARAFGLSPAETRLALLIGNGTSPSQAAAELGIARETVRSQLKSVFAKTGTHRQAELAVLLARLARVPKAKR